MTVTMSRWPLDIGNNFLMYSRNWVGCTKDSNCSKIARSVGDLEAVKTAIVALRRLQRCSSCLGLFAIQSSPLRGIWMVNISPDEATAICRESGEAAPYCLASVLQFCARRWQWNGQEAYWLPSPVAVAAVPSIHSKKGLRLRESHLGVES
jgi:hypothetical protein